MIKKTINRTIPITVNKEMPIEVYIAEDGHEFNTEKECIEHEKNSELRKKWEQCKFSVIGEEKILDFFFIDSYESLISLIGYLMTTKRVWVISYEYTRILREKDKYIGHWITYDYDDSGDNTSFYLWTLEEREEEAKKSLDLLTNELNFYAMLKNKS